MANLTPEQIRERRQRFVKLSLTLQDALFSEAVALNIRAIAEKNALSENVSDLAEAIGDVLLGILHPNLFIRALVDRLSLSPEKARTVALEVSSQIFSKVRNDLLKLYQIPGQTSSMSSEQNPSRGAPAPTSRPAVGWDRPTPRPQLPPPANTVSLRQHAPATPLSRPSVQNPPSTPNRPLTSSPVTSLPPLSPTPPPMTPTQAALSGNTVNLRSPSSPGT